MIVKAIINLFSYEKRTFFLHENTHPIIPCKNFFFKYIFFVPQYRFCFCFTLEVEGVLFFLMVSCLHKKFESK